MRAKTLRILAALISLVLVAAACGSDVEVDTASQAESPGTTAMDAMEHDGGDDEGMDHDEHDDAMDHEHGGDVVDVAESDAPTVELLAVAGSIYEYDIKLENLEFGPDADEAEHVPGEGHFHLLVDGVKIKRFFELHVTVDELEPGDHRIEVEVNANDHAPYAIDGVPIRSGVNITVEGDAGDATSIDVGYVGGSVETASDRVQVELGSKVVVSITSDVAESVHVHGYDLFADLEPGEPSKLAFAADVAGIFEVELEGSGTFLFEVEVS